MATWKQRDGTPIEVEDMGLGHIQNALNMLLRKGCISPRTVKAYLSYPPPNGDMAMMSYDRECDEVFEKIPHSFIDIFEDEIERRTKK